MVCRPDHGVISVRRMQVIPAETAPMAYFQHSEKNMDDNLSCK
jgi:hypothetical protein